MRITAGRHFRSQWSALAAAITLVILCTVEVMPGRALGGNGNSSPGAGQVQVPGSGLDAKRRADEDSPSLQGMIQPNDKIEIRAPIDGLVEKVGFEEGSPVKQGQLLVQFSNSGLAAEVAAAEADLKSAQLIYDRLHDANDRSGAGQEGTADAEAALAVKRAALAVKKNQLAQTRITAPCDGIMGASELRAGQTVSARTLVGTLYDVSSLKVQFNVSRSHISQLRPGQKVEVKVEDVYPSETLEGTIYFISPASDEATLKYPVKAKLPKTDLRLLPGMFATVRMTFPPLDQSDAHLSSGSGKTFTEQAPLARATHDRDTTTASETNAGTAAKLSGKRALLREEISLAEKQVDLLRNRFRSGLAEQDPLRAAERDLFSLRRQVAALDGDRKKEVSLIEEELNALEQEILACKQLVQNRVGSELSLLSLERERLALKRELLDLR